MIRHVSKRSVKKKPTVSQIEILEYFTLDNLDTKPIYMLFQSSWRFVFFVAGCNLCMRTGKIRFVN